MARPPLSSFITKPPLSSFKKPSGTIGAPSNSNFASEFAGGFAAEVPKVAANTGAATFDVLSMIPGSPLGFVNKAQQYMDVANQGAQNGDFDFSKGRGAQQMMQEGGATLKKKTQEGIEKLGVHTDTGWSKGGEVVADIVGALAARKAMPTTKNFYLDSLIGTGASTAAMEGRMPTPLEAGAGLGIDSVLAGAGKLFKGIRDASYSNVLRQTPTDKRYLAERGIDVGEELTRSVGFAPTRASFEKKLITALQKQGANLDEAIKLADDMGNAYDSGLLTKGLDKVDEVAADLLRKSARTDKKQVVEKYLAELGAAKAEIPKGKLTTSQLVEQKRIADAIVPYDKKNPVVNATALVNKKIADNARAMLPEGVSVENAKYAPLKALNDIMFKRPTTSGLAGDIVGMAAGGDLKSKIINVLAQRVYRTPAIQTGIATIANNLAKVAGKDVSKTILKNTVVLPIIKALAGGSGK